MSGEVGDVMAQFLLLCLFVSMLLAFTFREN